MSKTTVEECQQITISELKTHLRNSKNVEINSQTILLTETPCTFGGWRYWFLCPSSFGELSRKHEVLKKRLDNLYTDKLDGKITESFYDTKFKEFSKEFKQVDNKLNNLSNSTIKFFELSNNFYEVSQHAREIYKEAKTLEKKRSLI